MTKLLLATLLLTTSLVQAHHLQVATLPAVASWLHSSRLECRVANDPETQVGNGMVPKIVEISLSEDLMSDAEWQPEAETTPL